MVPGFLLSDDSKIEWILCVYQISATQSQFCRICLKEERRLCRVESPYSSCWQSKWNQVIWHIHSSPGWYATLALPGDEYNCFWGEFLKPEDALKTAQRRVGSVQIIQINVPRLLIPCSILATHTSR